MQNAKRQPSKRAIQSFRLFFLIAAFGWTALLYFGSWYPFRFVSFDWSAALRDWWSRDWTQTAKSDLVVNFLAGGPLGFTGYLAIAPKRRWWSMLAAAVITVLLLVCVSASVEIVQAGLATRTSSWLDTFTQVLGGGVGMVVAAICQASLLRHLASLFGTSASESPSAIRALRIRAALAIYLGGYAIWILLPFIPAISPSELKEKWHSGLIQLSPIEPWFADPWQAAYTALTASLTAIPVGLWFASKFEAADYRRNRLTAALAASLLVICLEICQLAIQTRTVATADMVWSAVGAMLGVGLYCRLLSGSLEKRDGEQVSHSMSKFPLTLLITVAYSMLYLTLAWAPFDWVESKAEAIERIESFRSVGWRNELSGNDLGFVTGSIRIALWSLLLGGLCGLTWLRARRSIRWLVAAIMVAGAVGLCGISEAGQLFLTDRYCSIISVFVRLAATGLGAFLVLSLFATTRNSTTVH